MNKAERKKINEINEALDALLAGGKPGPLKTDNVKDEELKHRLLPELHRLEKDSRKSVASKASKKLAQLA